MKATRVLSQCGPSAADLPPGAEPRLPIERRIERHACDVGGSTGRYSGVIPGLAGGLGRFIVAGMLVLRSRRAFLTQAVGLGVGTLGLGTGCRTIRRDPTGQIMTVLGPITPRRLCVTLPHEHVVVDFIGADRTSPDRCDADQALTLALSALQGFRALGGSALVECTPAYIGRNAALLVRLSQASKIHLLTNTGYYGAVNNKYLPRHALTESADDLAARWQTEWEAGIEGTGVRPGFIKLGVEAGPLSELHAKLVRAGARLHRQTGLTIAVHTGDGAAARDEVRVLREEAVAPEALIWVHAQNDSGPIQLELARAGVWISLDGFSAATGVRDRYIEALQRFRAERLLHRVLLSHDDGWAVEGAGPRGTGLKLFGNGNAAPYRSLFTELFPALASQGFTSADLRLLTIANPRRAFTISRRLLR